MIPRILFALAGWVALAAPAVSLTPADIDAHLANAQAAAEVQPAPPANDAAFLRRVSLDVRGVVPSLEETIAFLLDTKADKRERLVGQMLASPQRGEYWAAYWDKLLVGQLTEPGNVAIQRQLKSEFRDWIARQFNGNLPYDEFLAEIVSVEGTTEEAPQNLALARWRGSPENMAGTISRVFLGADIQCAQCHDHKENPELTQRKFWEFAAFFANTRAIPSRNEMGRAEPSVEVVDTGFRWQFEVPDTQPAMQVTPAYLDGSEPTRKLIDEAGEEVSLRDLLQQSRRFRNSQGAKALAAARENPDSLTPGQLRLLQRDAPRVRDTRRRELARLMAHGDSDQVARNFMNRLWARYFGRGLMEPLDGWATPATPDHPGLLAALTDEFVASGFDVRHMEALILATQAYGRASTPSKSSARMPELFAHAMVRPLAPDQLINSIAQVTQSAPLSGEGGRRGEALRAQFERQFSFAFDSDEMEWTTTFDPSIPRALFFLNEPTINRAVVAQGETFLASVTAKTSEPGEVLDYLFLAALNRYPDSSERPALLGMLTRASGDKREFAALCEDLLWSLITSSEFISNH